MRHGVASSAFGRMPLHSTIYEAHVRSYDHLMITIGSTPINSVQGCVDFCRQQGISVSVHHNAPIGEDKIIYAEQTDEMIRQLTKLGITRYSQHPPPLVTFSDWDQAINWALETWRKYRDAGIEFSLETMYPIRHKGTEKECWLPTPTSVLYFVNDVQPMGWQHCVTADVSHMHIAGWTAEQVMALIDHQCIAEVHYSANDGIHDQHRPIGNAEPESTFLTLMDTHPLQINEGRIKYKPMQRRTP